MSAGTQQQNPFFPAAVTEAAVDKGMEHNGLGNHTTTVSMPPPNNEDHPWTKQLGKGFSGSGGLATALPTSINATKVDAAGGFFAAEPPTSSVSLDAPTTQPTGQGSSNQDATMTLDTNSNGPPSGEAMKLNLPPSGAIGGFSKRASPAPNVTSLLGSRRTASSNTAGSTDSDLSLGGNSSDGCSSFAGAASSTSVSAASSSPKARPFGLSLPSSSGGKGSHAASRSSSSTGAASALGRPGSSQSLAQDVGFLQRVTQLTPEELMEHLDVDGRLDELPDLEKEATLVLDIRPSTQFRAAHLIGSVSLCAPSTLLKRRAVTVERIENDILAGGAAAAAEAKGELSDPNTDRRRFQRWKTAVRSSGIAKKQSDSNGDSSTPTPTPTPTLGPNAGKKIATPLQRIVVLDMDTENLLDSGKASSGGGGACLVGLLHKFEDAGFTGELCWLAGGYKRFVTAAQASKYLRHEFATPDRDPQHQTKSRLSVASAKEATAPGPQAKSNRRASAPFFAKGFGMPGFKFASPFAARQAGGEGGDAATSSDEQDSTLTDANGMHASLPASTNAAISPMSGISSGRASLVQPRGLPREAFTAQSTMRGKPDGLQGQNPDASDALVAAGGGGERVGEEQGWTGTTKTKKSVGGGETACANPFFDNIRQNRELAHGVTEKIPLELPSISAEEKEALPRFLQKLVDLSPDERARTLAQNFFDIDRAEQDRLNATMRQHASESSIDPRQVEAKRSGSLTASSTSSSSISEHDPSTPPILAPSNCCMIPGVCSSSGERFPYSISAALERGSDNRYNNIWTYEHSRVRLAHPQVSNDPGSDYLNGSYVEPARRYGCQRRFIATQAPLPSTFGPFWQVIWEQNCHVIVMLSRENEGGRLQCHDYWSKPFQNSFLRAELIDEIRITDAGKILETKPEGSAGGGDGGGGGGGGGFFSAADSGSTVEEPSIIRRTIRLTNTSRPDQSPRNIVQLQYLEWPDYFVPSDSGSLLNLVELADQLQHKYDQELASYHSPLSRSAASKRATPSVGPMVVHCSAGVGRTGTFMVIDALLDVLRRERRSFGSGRSLGCWDDGIMATSDWHFSQSFNDLPPADSARPSRHNSTRRSLKRELSPSAASMDTDSDVDHSSLSSPPPAFRRTRSRETTSEESGSNWQHSSPLLTPNKALHNLNLASSPPTGGGAEPMEDVIEALEPPTVHREAPLMQRDGSTASSNADSHLSGHSSTISSSGKSSSGSSGGPLRERGPSNSSTSFSLLFSKAGSASAASSARMPSFGFSQEGDDGRISPAAVSALATDADLIKQATETVRQQRMSSVQTTRQYVFLHLAILEGALRDFRRWKKELKSFG